MKKVTLIPYEDDSDHCCFGSSTKGVFVELDCDNSGSPLNTEENRIKIEEVKKKFSTNRFRTVDRSTY